MSKQVWPSLGQIRIAIQQLRSRIHPESRGFNDRMYTSDSWAKRWSTASHEQIRNKPR